MIFRALPGEHWKARLALIAAGVAAAGGILASGCERPADVAACAAKCESVGLYYDRVQPGMFTREAMACVCNESFRMPFDKGGPR